MLEVWLAGLFLVLPPSLLLAFQLNNVCKNAIENAHHIYVQCQKQALPQTHHDVHDGKKVN